jgi:hypothetical protein
VAHLGADLIALRRQARDWLARGAAGGLGAQQLITQGLGSLPCAGGMAGAAGVASASRAEAAPFCCCDGGGFCGCAVVGSEAPFLPPPWPAVAPGPGDD